MVTYNKTRNGMQRAFVNKLNALSNVVKGQLLSFRIGKRMCLSYEKRSSPLFASVEIETTSICNRKCSYCPNSNTKRPAVNMKEELYYKIVDELADIGFSGRFSPHLYGEPLVDKRIVRFVAYARNKLPNAFIKLFTNGDKLTYEVFNELIEAGVDIVRIAQHDESPSLTLSDTLKKIDDRIKKDHIEYVKYFNNDEDLMNRGGLIEVKHDTEMKYCNYVSGITIDYAGNMLLCCQDFLSRYRFGNLEEESINGVWNSKNYKLLRDKIKCGIWPLDICKICNDKGPSQ